jgi:hypothetical protein
MRRIFIWPILIVLGTIVLVAYLSRSEESLWPDDQFTVERWRATEIEQRYVMAKDLVHRRLLDGKSKADVIAFLGEPESGRMEGGITYRDNFSYVVRTGSRSVSFNAVWFIRILFDPATGKVQDYAIAGD